MCFCRDHETAVCYDDDADLPSQDDRLHRLVKEFGSNSWSSVSLHFKVSNLISL